MAVQGGLGWSRSSATGTTHPPAPCPCIVEVSVDEVRVSRDDLDETRKRLVREGLLLRNIVPVDRDDPNGDYIITVERRTEIRVAE